MKLYNNRGFITFLFVAFSAFAKAEEQDSEQSQLEERVERLEEKAVQGDNKKLYISGQVNRALLWGNNGTQSSVQHVDNLNSPSSLRIQGEAEFNDDVEVGGIFELGIQPNSTQYNDIHQAQSDSNSIKDIEIRIAELYARNIKYGTLTVGRGYMASYGDLYFTDLSGAYNFRETWMTVGAIRFTDKSGVKGPSTLSALNVMYTGDGVGHYSRQDRVRYDSPKLYGLSFSTSHGYQNQGDIWDATLKFAGKFNGWAVSTQIGYGQNNSKQVEETGVADISYTNLAGSVGLLAPYSYTGAQGAGIVGYAGFAKRDYTSTSYSNGRAREYKLGYKDSFFNAGQSIVSGSVVKATNMVLDPTSSSNTIVGKSWGLGVQQNLDKASTEVYARYDHVTLERQNSGTSYNPIDVVMVGARVKL